MFRIFWGMEKKNLTGNRMKTTLFLLPVSSYNLLCKKIHKGLWSSSVQTDRLLLPLLHFGWRYLIPAKYLILHSCSDHLSVLIQAPSALAYKKTGWLLSQPTWVMLLPPGFKATLKMLIIPWSYVTWSRHCWMAGVVLWWHNTVNAHVLS